VPFKKKCSNCCWVIRLKWTNGGFPFLCGLQDGRCLTDGVCKNWKGIKYDRNKQEQGKECE
jgi:hypothetical protein